MTQPAIAVVGVGAIGGVVAAALADAGHCALLCVRTPFDHLERTYVGEPRRYDNPVHTDPGQVGVADWVLLATKAHQVDGAEPWLRALVGPHTRIAVMQNGIGHAERVARHAPAERVVPCIMMLPADSEGPGVVSQEGPGTISVPDSEAGRALAALLPEGPVTVEPTADFATAAWKKLALNAVGGGVCTLALTPIGATAAPEVRDLAVGAMREVIAVGEAEGARFPADFIEQTMTRMAGPVGRHWGSITVDRKVGRSLEWRARNAVIGELGRRHGIATPLNDALTSLLALVDARLAEERAG